MFKRLVAIYSLLVIAVVGIPALAQTPLQLQIQSIAATVHGRISVACGRPQSSLVCDLNADSHPPMQSVFKLPLALAVLSRVEGGALSLDQSIRFLPSDRILPHTHSPLQDKYPEGNANVPLGELLRLSVSFSDNTATDILLRVIGGPKVVDEYVAGIGIRGFHVEDNEHVLHIDDKAQYRNWFEPAAAVELLRRISDKPPILPAHAQLLLQWMTDGPTGAKRIKGELPAGTAVAHKTGTSGVDHGVVRATNDIGLITLPDGRRLALAVFVTDCTSGEAACEAVIAHIARAVYDAHSASKNP